MIAYRANSVSGGLSNGEDWLRDNQGCLGNMNRLRETIRCSKGSLCVWTADIKNGLGTASGDLLKRSQTHIATEVELSLPVSSR